MKTKALDSLSPAALGVWGYISRNPKGRIKVCLERLTGDSRLAELKKAKLILVRRCQQAGASDMLWVYAKREA